eukprot:2949699-Prymnesium_polylepis.1
MKVRRASLVPSVTRVSVCRRVGVTKFEERRLRRGNCRVSTTSRCTVSTRRPDVRGRGSAQGQRQAHKLVSRKHIGLFCYNRAEGKAVA